MSVRSQPRPSVCQHGCGIASAAPIYEGVVDRAHPIILSTLYVVTKVIGIGTAALNPIV